MNEPQPDSLDPFRRLEDAWHRYKETGGNRPCWRDFLTDRQWERQELLDFCTVDIECRLTIGQEQPPISQDYAGSEGQVVLDEAGEFELLRFEYQWCWRQYIGAGLSASCRIKPLTKAEYKRIFSPCLAAQIDAELKIVWVCRRCRRKTQGDEGDDPLGCQHCGLAVAGGAPGIGEPPSEYLTPDPDHPPPAEHLGPYRLGRWLGDGGMGDVYVGWEKILRRLVAVKVLKPNLALRPDARARFEREGRAAAAIRHNHIVPVLYADTDQGILFLAMPLLQGETLEAQLKRETRLSAADVVKLGREAALGLAAVHAAGFIHRDVKPGNLWLEQVSGGEWQVAVMDFGLARSGDGADAVSLPGVFCGSPPYTSPEQAAGRPLDGRSDLFGLGCVLYEAATGIRAFRGGNTLEVIAAVGSDQPRAPHEIEPTLPPQLSDLIVRLLEKEPDKRPASATVVAETLDRMNLSKSDAAPLPIVPPEPIPDLKPPLSSLQSEKRLWTRRRAIVACLGVLGVAGGGATWKVIDAFRRYSGKVDVWVWPKGPDRGGVAGGAPLSKAAGKRTLPLRAGDGFKIEATVNRPAFLYLFWVNPDGKTVAIYPWRAARPTPEQWGVRPTEEQRVDRTLLLPPSVGKGFTIKADEAGMETLILVGRDQTLRLDDDTVRGWFAGLPPQRPVQSPGSVVWFDNGKMVTDDTERTRADFAETDLGDPVLRIQELLNERIMPHAQFTSAVCFATNTKEKS